MSGSRERPDFIFGRYGPFTATSAVLPLPASRCPPCKGRLAGIHLRQRQASRGADIELARSPYHPGRPEWPLASFDDAIVSLRGGCLLA